MKCPLLFTVNIIFSTTEDFSSSGIVTHPPRVKRFYESHVVVCGEGKEQPAICLYLATCLTKRRTAKPQAHHKHMFHNGNHQNQMLPRINASCFKIHTTFETAAFSKFWPLFQLEKARANRSYFSFTENCDQIIFPMFYTPHERQV